MIIRRILPIILLITALISVGTSAQVYAHHDEIDLHGDHTTEFASIAITTHTIDCASACGQNSRADWLTVNVKECKRKKENKLQSVPVKIDQNKPDAQNTATNLPNSQVVQNVYKLVCSYLL